MNTRELRIGNYVKVGDNIVKVNGITQHKIGYAPDQYRERYARSREVEPIELSIADLRMLNDDVANKFNFLYQDSGVNGLNLVCFGSAIMTVKFLHQLQNIYYMFYGEELVVSALLNQGK